VRVLVLLGALWLLSAADLFFTLWAHYFTPFVEGNPVVARVFAAMPYSLVFVPLVGVKVVTVGVGTLIFWKLRRHARAELGLWLVVGVLGYVLLLWSGYTSHWLADAKWWRLFSSDPQVIERSRAAEYQQSQDPQASADD
jgi:hypothetical protein